MFTLHRSRLGSQSQWLHWESESESESESGNVKEPLLALLLEKKNKFQMRGKLQLTVHFKTKQV